MNTLLTLIPWLVVACCVLWTVNLFIGLVRFKKLCDQRTAVFKAAIAAAKRNDFDEFHFLEAEWKKLAAECERQMGINHE